MIFQSAGRPGIQIHGVPVLHCVAGSAQAVPIWSIGQDAGLKLLIVALLPFGTWDVKFEFI